MTIDLSSLATAADKWQDMAGEFHKVEQRYKDSVQKITTGPDWVGGSANAAGTAFAATRYEYQAAQTQAKATATLLRNAHQQFTELKKQLESGRADAVKAGMKVSEQGNVAFDWDRLTAQERTDLEQDATRMAKVKTDEQSWRDYLTQCVKLVDEADQDLKKDLEAVVKDGTGGKNDGTPGTGFNGGADAVAKADDAQKKERLELASLAMRGDETLDDYLLRLQREGVTRLTGSERLGKLWAAYAEGTMTAGAFAAATGGTLGSSFKLFTYLKSDKIITAPGTFFTERINMRLNGAVPGSMLSKIPPGAVRALTGSDEAAMLAGYMRNGRFYMPTAGEANLLKVAQKGGMANAAKAAGWLRGAGVVGGVMATGYGIANLATYDSAQIKADPAKFASDLSGTAFSASMTALTVAPNPITAGLAIGTGVVYGAALVWDNWEDIEKGAKEAKEWVGNQAEKIGDGIADGAKKVTEGIADGAKKVGSALNPFD
ncbi:hypothetical protein [Streptomyces yaizuensis]|uniref:WXG100 family type VII secretion target n=1 Tax=Streptomyces yaizuensis TaxID=2989713 RepID=A0ABQ5NYJ8_9ACTN|nr:hypothetical protein [Streptomyces sp. YSPA8]GLF95434.1 hypothetical protein SYYSPA8_14075 [Streptomyces sp. YSPA8]